MSEWERAGAVLVFLSAHSMISVTGLFPIAGVDEPALDRVRVQFEFAGSPVWVEGPTFPAAIIAAGQELQRRMVAPHAGIGIIASTAGDVSGPCNSPPAG